MGTLVHRLGQIPLGDHARAVADGIYQFALGNDLRPVVDERRGHAGRRGALGVGSPTLLVKRGFRRVLHGITLVAFPDMSDGSTPILLFRRARASAYRIPGSLDGALGGETALARPVPEALLLAELSPQRFGSFRRKFHASTDHVIDFDVTPVWSPDGTQVAYRSGTLVKPTIGFADSADQIVWGRRGSEFFEATGRTYLQ